jgi:hypothetical protein
LSRLAPAAEAWHIADDPSPYSHAPVTHYKHIEQGDSRLCEHETSARARLHQLTQEYGYLYRCCRHNHHTEGVFPPYIELEQGSGNIIATTIFRLTGDFQLGSSVTQVALEDLRTALITLDRMVCTHLRTSHGYRFRSLTRDSHLSEEETQSANDPSYAEMPVVVLKHATGRCSDPYCDTTYRLNWTFGLESIQLHVTRRLGKMLPRASTIPRI